MIGRRLMNPFFIFVDIYENLLAFAWKIFYTEWEPGWFIGLVLLLARFHFTLGNDNWNWISGAGVLGYRAGDLFAALGLFCGFFVLRGFVNVGLL